MNTTLKPMTQTETTLHAAPIIEIPGEPEVHLAIADYGDTEALYEAVTKNRSHLDEFEAYGRSIRTLEDAARYNDSAVGFSRLGMSLEYRIRAGKQPQLPSSSILGVVTLFGHDSQKRTVDFGYWVDKDVEGTGLARRSVEALLGYGKHVLGLAGVSARIIRGNVRSESLAVRLGCDFSGDVSVYDETPEGDIRLLTMGTWSKTL